MKKIIRTGIIGQGRSGWSIHADYLRTDKRYQIVAVADPIKSRRDFAIKTLGCDAVADYRKLLDRDDLDLVVNASLSHQHTPITLAALKAEHNVLCEKPFCRTVKEADKMIAAAEKADRLLAVYQQARYAPYFECVQKVIRSGVLGRIVQISIRFNGFSRRWDWQTLKEYNGGSLRNTGPHPLDQALVLFGEGMPKVTCMMDRTKEGCFGNAENHVKLLLTGKGHPIIDLEISSCCPYPFFTYNIYGSRGGLQASTTAAEWKYFKPSEAPRQKLLRKPLANEEGRPLYPNESLTMHTGSWSAENEKTKGSTYSAAAAPSLGGMTGRFYDDLYKSLTRAKPLVVTLQQVRRQIAVIEEAHRQNRSL